MAENSLRKLRREAGFSSAKAFAESVGIPAPTYAKYEQIDDGPETPMPIKNAWLIADALGCSIDNLVGRCAAADAGDMGAELQRRFNALSEDGKDLMTDYMDMLEARERRVEEQRRAEVVNKFADSMYTHLIHFLGKAKLEEDPDGVIPIRKDSLRGMFESYVEAQVEENWAEWVDSQLAELEQFNAERGFAIRQLQDADHVEQVFPGEDGYEEALEEMLDGPREGFVRYTRQRVREAVKGVMAAYDELIPDTKGGEVEYALVSMP